MEWEDKLENMFEQILLDTPEMFRDVVRKTVGRHAESNAKDRGALLVSSQDLISAFMSETPQVSQPQMTDSLKKIGIPDLDLDREIDRVIDL